MGLLSGDVRSRSRLWPRRRRFARHTDPPADALHPILEQQLRQTTFDGNIASMMPDSSYPNHLATVLIHAGDYSTTSVRGPEMQIKTANSSDFGDATGFPSWASEGASVHMTVTIGSYDSMSGPLEPDFPKIIAR